MAAQRPLVFAADATAPPHVVAYAAGVQAILGCDWGTVSGYIAQMGMGSFHPGELGEAAERWSAEHVAPEVIERLRRSRARRKVKEKRG